MVRAQVRAGSQRTAFQEQGLNFWTGKAGRTLPLRPAGLRQALPDRLPRSAGIPRPPQRFRGWSGKLLEAHQARMLTSDGQPGAGRGRGRGEATECPFEPRKSSVGSSVAPTAREAPGVKRLDLFFPEEGGRQWVCSSDCHPRGAGGREALLGRKTRASGTHFCFRFPFDP